MPCLVLGCVLFVGLFNSFLHLCLHICSVEIANAPEAEPEYEEVIEEYE
jgi:hypothetical protein